MATETFPHSSFGDGAVVVETDINTANWKMAVVRCINNSSYPASVTILESGVPVFTAVAPAGATTTWNTGGLQLGWQPDYWNDISETWEPGGIEMGDYVLQATWPWES